MLITISNLFPRPDQPTRGLYNFYLFREVSGQWAVSSEQWAVGSGQYVNICLVPEWRVWRWRAIRRWAFSPSASHLSPLTAYSSTLYLPVFYLPVLGRSINWWFCYRALRDRVTGYGLLVNGAGGGVNSYKLSVIGDANNKHQITGNSIEGSPAPNNQSPITENDANVVFVPWLYPDGVAVAEAIRWRSTSLSNGADSAAGRDAGCHPRLWLMALGSDTFHLKSWYRRRKILEACAQAEGIICVAQVLADRLAAAGVPVEKLHVVPNGVDASLFRPRSKEELSVISYELSVIRNTNNKQLITNNGPASGGTILFVGNLVPVKGPDILLRAFAALGAPVWGGCPHPPSSSKADEDIRPTPRDKAAASLLLIGSGPMRAQLERLARELGIADRVHFLGSRPREEVALWMNRADVLCLASHSEGMPNVVLEARASGLPVVTTPAGAIPELPLDQEHFLVVKSCCPETLAAGLREMLARDVSHRKPDPAISSWAQMGEKILRLMDNGYKLSGNGVVDTDHP